MTRTNFFLAKFGLSWKFSVVQWSEKVGSAEDRKDRSKNGSKAKKLLGPDRRGDKTCLACRGWLCSGSRGIVLIYVLTIFFLSPKIFGLTLNHGKAEISTKEKNSCKEELVVVFADCTVLCQTDWRGCCGRAQKMDEVQAHRKSIKLG
jgi:hypothetical protein